MKRSTLQNYNIAIYTLTTVLQKYMKKIVKKTNHTAVTLKHMNSFCGNR